jgi:2-amino-4-hydroxy-6-hydroxymethyldihydropteridine diphosphokinase
VKNEQSEWTRAYVGIGSNLSDPRAQVEAAFDLLDALPGTKLRARSSLYRNPPLGESAQPDYVNAVAALETVLQATDLLGHLLAIERKQGRVRVAGERWGPRVLDLDLLVYGGQQVDAPGLVVPHPGISSRNFVLFPLLDVAPNLNVPGVGEVATLAAELGDAGLQRLS